MSFAMQKPSQSRTAHPTAGRPALRLDSTEQFCPDLLNGLHALAQPLSVLRAASEVLALPRLQGADQQKYIQTWCEQVERACLLFSEVQDMVAARLVAADRVRFDLWELLNPMIDQQRTLLHNSGVGIAVTNTAQRLPLCGDAERTANALQAVLRMASVTAARGDVIELHTSSDPVFLQLRFQNSRRHGRKMSSSDKLSLSLAVANITSQHGTYDFAEDPFCFSFSLPLDEQASARATRTATRACTH
jgi:hypothetical protein